MTEPTAPPAGPEQDRRAELANDRAWASGYSAGRAAGERSVREAIRREVSAAADRLDTFCGHCEGDRRILTNAVDLPYVERLEPCLDSIHAAADQLRAITAPDTPAGAAPDRTAYVGNATRRLCNGCDQPEGSPHEIGCANMGVSWHEAGAAPESREEAPLPLPGDPEVDIDGEGY